MNKIKTISKWAVPAVMITMPLLVLALPIDPGTVNIPTGGALTLNEIKNIIVTVANTLMVVGVILAVVFLAWGGIKYMTARGDPTNTKEAMGVVKNGVIGLVILFGIGVILRTAAGLITRSFFG